MEKCKECDNRRCIAKGKDREVLCSAFVESDPFKYLNEVFGNCPPLKREIELPAL